MIIKLLSKKDKVDKKSKLKIVYLSKEISIETVVDKKKISNLIIDNAKTILIHKRRLRIKNNYIINILYSFSNPK